MDGEFFSANITRKAGIIDLLSSPGALSWFFLFVCGLLPFFLFTWVLDLLDFRHLWNFLENITANYKFQDFHCKLKALSSGVEPCLIPSLDFLENLITSIWDYSLIT